MYSKSYVLGPLLFVIYVNDLASQLLNPASLFADDIELIGNPTGQNNEYDLDILDKWSEDWDLPLKAKKCMVLRKGLTTPLRRTLGEGDALHELEVVAPTKDWALPSRQSSHPIVSVSKPHNELIIGSPKSGINGEILWCPLDRSTCDKINVDVADLARTHPGINDALFGYSITSMNSSLPGKVTVCAPRLTRMSASLHYMTGGCFELDSEMRNPTVLSDSITMCQDLRESDRYIDLRHCAMGASVAQHPSQPDAVFMGGPYFNHGKGIAAILNRKSFTRMKTTVEDILPNELLGSALDVSDSIFAQRSGSEKPVHMASGGPGVPVTDDGRSEFGNGMVLIYPGFKDPNALSIDPVLRVDGQRFGSRFGHAVILIDVNGDGWEDLIVGAPYQRLEALAGSHAEYGAVHVFLNQQATFPTPVDDQSTGFKVFDYLPAETYQLLTPSDKSHNCGSVSLAGYGATLVELGDINHDGLPDFAVGAPYSSDGGVVFIYHGSKTGKIDLPTQVICSTKLKQLTELKGLGFSMGLKGLDLDGNGYADMAIGAPLSDSVVVLRARPIIRFNVHMTLPRGQTTLPASLDTLPDCTQDASTLPGYKAERVRCLEVKLFATYTSIDGRPCQPQTTYKLPVLLKADPANEWLSEWDHENRKRPAHERIRRGEQCDSWQRKPIDSLLNKMSIASVSFIGERPVMEFGAQSDPFFTVNQSATLAGLKSPGGYFTAELEATCRMVEGDEVRTSAEELNSAKTVRLVFRDVNFVDQTNPIKIGVRWHAKMPSPFPPPAMNIDKYPIANPRENSQLIQLKFDNPCSTEACCPKLKVTYEVDMTRDTSGPVVYVGDDKTQTIVVRARVSNMGSDPAYMLSLVSTYPSELLELDSQFRTGKNIAPNAASCYLANPLLSGETAECEIRWLVVGHQLTVQQAHFTVNSTLMTTPTVEGPHIQMLLVTIKMLVNVSISGMIEPSTSYFSGTVSDGVSSILAENQVGDSRLLIKFTVSNQRKHSLVPSSRLIIDWPYEISGDPDESHGKYMLYLLDNPTVVQQLQPVLPGGASINRSTVACDSRALKRLVNPHGYRIFPFLRPTSDSIPVTVRPVDLPESHPPNYPPLAHSPFVEDLAPPFTDNSPEDEKRKMTKLSCYNGQIRCVPIVCDLDKLSYKAGPITLELTARLWDNTMREDFRGFFLSLLNISATWRADVKYEIDLGDSDHAQDDVQLLIFNNLEPKPVPPKYMVLYIGLAVFGGLLLLACIAITMKQLGFFKRRRKKQNPTAAAAPIDPNETPPTENPPLDRPTAAYRPLSNHPQMHAPPMDYRQSHALGPSGEDGYRQSYEPHNRESSVSNRPTSSSNPYQSHAYQGAYRH